MLVIKKPSEKLIIKSNETIVNTLIYIYNYVKEFKEEVLFCAFIKDEELLELNIVNKGSHNEVSVPIMEIIKRAIAVQASEIAIYHTHPTSGELLFSDKDYAVRRLFGAYASEFNINIRDFGVINFANREFLSNDNNIYKCKNHIYNNKFKILKNAIMPNFHTLFLNKHGVNNIKDNLKLG